MATADDLRDGIAANLAALSGWRVVSREGGQTQPPALRIGMPRPVSRLAFDGCWAWECSVIAYVQTSSLRAADVQLAPLLDTSGSSSLIVAVEADRTLGGAATDVECSGVNDIGLEDIEGGTFAFAEFTLKIME